MTERPLAGRIGPSREEFLDLPFEPRRCALIDGEIVVNRPDASHHGFSIAVDAVFAH